MCGRFYLDTDKQIIENIFGVSTDNLEFTSRYNIAPSQPLLTITQDRQDRHPQFMRWGLIPSWSKGIDSRYSMINARAESIHQKPAYKRSFKHTRCLIPASGFYEWRKENDSKQPYCITRKDAELMTFAGIWDSWNSPDETIQSFSIITTDAASSIKHIHERMPVILDKKAFNTWLDPENQDTDQLRDILIPFNSSNLNSWPVSKAVNSPANDDRKLIEAVS